MKRVKYRGAIDQDKPRITLSFSCPIELANEVIEEAQAMELTLSQYIRRGLKTYLAQSKNER